MGKMFVTIAVLFCLLCAVGIASAETVYTQSKSGVVFDENIDATAVYIEKSDDSIKMSSEEHAEGKIKIKEEDVEVIRVLRASVFNDL